VKSGLTWLQHSPIMMPMPRGNQYCTVTLAQLNEILRPNAKVVISRKFADCLSMETKIVNIRAGKSTAIFRRIAEDSLADELKTVPENAVSLKVENWNE
jgi:hypothetical protein